MANELHLPGFADWIRSTEDAVDGAGDIFWKFGVVANSFEVGAGEAGAGSSLLPSSDEGDDFSCLITLISI